MTHDAHDLDAQHHDEPGHEVSGGQVCGVSAMADYLRRIGWVALLSREEEVALAKAIEAGVFAQRILGSGRVLGQGERREYEALVEAGRAARRAMIEANLRLVVSMARRYRWADQQLRDELIQEGNIGLIGAVERFDYRRGTRFSTLAGYWIAKGFGRVWGTTRDIRLPAGVMRQVRAVAAARAGLLESLHREPSVAEIAAKLGLSPQRVADLLIVGQHTASLDAPVAEDGTGLGDLLADQSMPDPAEVVTAQEQARAVRAVVDGLPRQQRDVIRVRFGIGTGRPASLQETAAILDLSEARVRQLEAKTLAALRHPARAGLLQDRAA